MNKQKHNNLVLPKQGKVTTINTIIITIIIILITITINSIIIMLRKHTIPASNESQQLNTSEKCIHIMQGEGELNGPKTRILHL